MKCASSVLLVALALGCSGAKQRTNFDRSSAKDARPDPPSTEPPAQPIRQRPIAAHIPAGACGLERPAFCETFETRSPGGRGGDLDEARWHFSRYGHQTRQFFVRIPASSRPFYHPRVNLPASFCGKPFQGLLPYDDVAICSGIGVDGMPSSQLNEVYDDQGDFAFNSMRIRQLFDFTRRTGTIVLDVDAKINPENVGHGWWIEVFVTEDTAPMPYHESPSVISFPRNGVGFVFQGLNSCPQGRWANELSRVFVTKNYEILHDYPGWELEHDSDARRCFKTADGKLNRIKIALSKDEAEVWVSDHDSGGSLHRIAKVSNLDLAFTRGYVHLQHSQYNAHKDGEVTPVQTYRWDNVGFDGPTYPLPRVYEVEDNNQPDIDGTGGRMYGYYLNDRDWTSVQIENVDLKGASSATLSFSFFISNGRSLIYRFNGREPHVFRVPSVAAADAGLRGFAVDVPLADLVPGTNQLDMKMVPTQEEPWEAVANIDLSLEATQ